MNLFSFKKKDWGEEYKAQIKKIKLGDTNMCVNVAYYFHGINGNEYLELFLPWLLEYWYNILKTETNTLLTGKVDCLLEFVFIQAKFENQITKIIPFSRFLYSFSTTGMHTC